MANKQPAQTEMGRFLDKVCAQLGTEHSPYALKKLAADVGVHISVLQRIRSGATQPSLLTIFKLSVGLGYEFELLASLVLQDAIGHGVNLTIVMGKPIDVSPKGLILGKMYDKGSDAQRQLFDRLMASVPVEYDTSEGK
jgi:transcriptional regulator with XRE-family HTH domain